MLLPAEAAAAAANYPVAKFLTRARFHPVANLVASHPAGYPAVVVGGPVLATHQAEAWVALSP